MRSALIVIVALVVVLVAALMVVPMFLDWNLYKADLAAWVEAKTGRALVIGGEIDFRLLPAPQLSAREVRLANISGAEAAEMISVAAVDIRVAFLPLLRGEIRIERIGLVDPVVSLERLSDGRSNWVFEPAGVAAGGTSPEAPQPNAPSDESTPAGGPSLDNLEIENGVVRFRDAATGRVVKLEQLDARVSAVSLDGPFTLDGALVASGQPITFALDVGSVIPGRVLPINIDVALPGAEVALKLNGKASEPSAAAELSGQLSVTASSAAKLGVAVGEVAGSGALRFPDEPFSLRVRIAASAAEAAFNEMSITLGEIRASGAVNAAYAEGVQVDVALAINSIDLDRLLATGESESGRGPASAGGANAQATNASTDTLALPDDFSGSFNLQVEALTYNNGIVRQLSVSARALDGVVDVSRAAALLPGGSDVTVSGSLVRVEGAPEFSGRMEAASDNLRTLLTWLAVDVAAIPADRLRKAVVSADAVLTSASARLSGIDLRLDSSRLTGQAAYRFGQRPAVSADLEVDRLNADAYRPVAEPDNASATTMPGAGDTAVAEAPFWDVDAFDAEVTLRVGEFTYNRIPAIGLLLDLTLVDGNLVVREASVQDIGSASMSIDGHASGFSGTPVFTGAITLVAENPGAFFQFARIKPPAPAARLSPLRVAGTFQAAADGVAIDVEGSAAGTQARLRGDISTATAESPTNLVFEVTNQSLVALIGQLVPGKPVGINGAVALTGTVTGPAEAMEIALHADLAGARVSVAGAVVAVEPITFDFALDITHPDATEFIGGLGIDYRPAAVNLGGLELKGRVAGSASTLAVSDIASSIGPVAVIGAVEVDLGGERPRVSANFRTSEIIVDLFLPVPVSDIGAGAAAPGEGAKGGGQGRWSTDPIDLRWLDTIDGELALASSAIDYGHYRFGEPSLTLVLASGVLDIARLSGRLYDGSVELTARIENAATPTVALAFRLDDADLLEALVESAGIDRASGRVAISADLLTEGTNQFELISALAGSGRFTAREGRVRGIDLGRLSTRLKQLNKITNYLGPIQASLSGGETAYSTLGGSFQISDGIVRTSDLKMSLDGAEAEGAGRVDLFRWLIDLRARASLVEHPDAPAVGLDLSGSLEAPRRNLRTRELEAYLTRTLDGAVVRKFLPDLGAADDTTQDQSPRAPAEGDAAESLLKDLLDRLGD